MCLNTYSVYWKCDWMADTSDHTLELLRRIRVESAQGISDLKSAKPHRRKSHYQRPCCRARPP